MDLSVKHSSWLGEMCKWGASLPGEADPPSRRMTRLVSMLMDASKLEAGRLKGSFRLVNLGIVTRDIVVSALRLS